MIFLSPCESNKEVGSPLPCVDLLRFLMILVQETFCCRGGPFTWSGGQNGCTMSMLDRFSWSRGIEGAILAGQCQVPYLD